MFDFAWSEMLLCAAVALIVIGPKELPTTLRTVGRWVGKARGVARHFRSGFDQMVREAELEEMEKRWRSENDRIMREHPADSGAPSLDPLPADDASPPPRSGPSTRRPGNAPPVKDIDESRAPLLDHLIELRRRLLWSVAAFAVCFGLCFWQARPIFAVLVQPLLEAGQGRLIYTNIFEAFFAEVKVGFFAGLMLAFPVIATQLWQFVAPGLYAKEKRALLPFILLTPVLFAMGASLAYFFAMPVALHFLLGFQGDVGGVQQTALPGVGNYLDFVTKFIFGFGVAFLLPVLLLLLEKAGIVTRQQLVGGRRYAIVIAFVLAAVLTPPDVISQVILAVPLILLYELTLLTLLVTERRRDRAQAGEAASES